MGKNQHVTKHPGGGWQVKGAGNDNIHKSGLEYNKWIQDFEAVHDAWLDVSKKHF